MGGWQPNEAWKPFVVLCEATDTFMRKMPFELSQDTSRRQRKMKGIIEEVDLDASEKVDFPFFLRLANLPGFHGRNKTDLHERTFKFFFEL